MTTVHKRMLCALVAGAAALMPASALAQEDGYYAGRTISLIVGFGVGGGYDIWGRAVANHIGKHLPGNPDVIVENMPGAGTLIATNHIANIAPRDGTVIGIVGRDVFMEPFLGNQSAQFDFNSLTFIGSAATETNVCVSFGDAAVQSVEDLLETELIVGDTGVNTGTYKYPKALTEILGFNFNIISGYPSSADVALAMEQGEVEGICESLDSLVTRHPDWLEDGTITLLFQGGVEPNPNLADIPFALDLAETEEDRQAIRFLYAGQFFGRPFIAPELPEEQTAMLRDAFMALQTDEEFLAELDRLGLEFDPVSGEAMHDFVAELEQTPQEVIDYVTEVTQ